MTNSSGILVAVDGTDTTNYMMERAIEQATLTEASIVVAHVMPEKRYQARQSALASVPNLAHDGTGYTIDVARAEALAIASRTANAALSDTSVEYAAVGAVGNVNKTLMELAEKHGCETIILAAEGSWWRRRIGSADRKLAQSFDGTVLRVPRSEPQLIDADPLVVDS